MQRTIDPELASYMNAVNTALEARCGVTYSEVLKEHAIEIDHLREAHGSNMSAAGFAEMVRNSLNFVDHEEVGAGAVREINQRRLALFVFTRENDGWKLGADGAIYQVAESGSIVRMGAAPSNSGDKWGFAIDVLEDGAVDLGADAQSLVVPAEDASFARVGSGQDISDVLAKYELRSDLTAGTGMGMN